MPCFSSWRSWCVVFLLGAVLGCAKSDLEHPISELTAGTEAKAPLLLDLDGRPFDLWYQDTITVVIFTRTDCPISNRCAPEVRRLHEKYHARGVEFYSIYVDPREQSADIRRHLREFEYPCAGLRDPKHALVSFCHATATPEAVVFARDHSIVYRGRVDDLYTDLGQARAEPTTHDLADAIESTIHGRPVANPRTKAVGCPIADLKN
jgi:hypothetical protein